MTRLPIRPRSEAEMKALKAPAARQRRALLKAVAAASKKVGSRASVGKASKTMASQTKACDNNTKSSGVKAKPRGKENAKIVKLASKKSKPAAKKSKPVVAKKEAVNKQKDNQTTRTKKGKAAVTATKKNKPATKGVVKKGKVATPAGKKNKPKINVVKKGKVATPAGKENKPAPAASKGRNPVGRGKGGRNSLLATKQGRAQPAATPTRKVTGKGPQLARTVASRGKGAKGRTSGKLATPTIAVGQKRVARATASATPVLKSIVGRKRAAKGPASPSHQPPPPKLARMDSINTQLRKAIAEATTPSSASTYQSNKAAASKTYKIDAVLKTGVSHLAKVYKDYSCMLNQTNIGFNNNKYYVIQIVEDSTSPNKRYIYFTRWGRVGESGQNKVERFPGAEKAVKAFEKKFFDKTYNGWSSRSNFTPKPKKYTLLEMDEDDDDDDNSPQTVVSKTTTDPSVRSSLDERTQRLAKIIFSDTMFMQQMADMNLDVNKMPLGKLSKSQIAKGLEALLDIEEAIKKGNRGAMNLLTSKFYTLIPHNFGRSVPPVIASLPVVQLKKDMLITLADIELTQTLQKTKGAAAETENPLDAKVNALGCTLTLVEQTSPEFKWIRAYAAACPNTRKHTLLDIWRVDRDGEHARFSRNDSIKYRKLLWHGTKVAVVAAILNSGLRIMPHSGGRVGRGIYFASEHAKSSGYVGIHNGVFEGEKNIGFMFLVEVALGRMNNITSSTGSQTAAPPGYDSIVARGWTEPDSGDEMEINYDGKKVIVPKGKPKRVDIYSTSHFSQSEYLVYREDQARIRYLLKFSFT